MKTTKDKKDCIEHQGNNGGDPMGNGETRNHALRKAKWIWV